MQTISYLPPLHCKVKRIHVHCVFASMSSRDRRRDIARAAAGKDLVIQRITPGKSVVNWSEAPDHVHSPVPNATNCENFRAHSGAHLVFNAFWNIQHFCVHQPKMLMRDPMHHFDFGAIVHLIRVILRKFKECVEIALDKVGLAAKKLRQRFELMLAKRNGPENQKYFIEHASCTTCNLLYDSV